MAHPFSNQSNRQSTPQASSKPNNKVNRNKSRSLMSQSLRSTSILAANTWQALNAVEAVEDEQTVLAQLWQAQSDQELAIDAHAELADQLDAEIAALEVRMNHFINLHAQAIERLRRWREKLDTTVLKLNEAGLLSEQAIGQTRTIKIKLNPPSCIILDPEAIPSDYLRTKLEYFPDKKAIIQAWKDEQAIPGTSIERKRRVVYELAATKQRRKV